MASAAKPIPDTRHAAIPCLCVRGAASAIEFYAKAFGAREPMRMADPGGKLEDPFGHVWWIATHKEDVSPVEMKRRAAALFGA